MIKKRFILIFSILSLTATYAQIVTIPDVIFKNALININWVDTNSDGFPDTDVDTNNDGEIQVSEVLYVNITNKNTFKIILWKQMQLVHYSS